MMTQQDNQLDIFGEASDMSYSTEVFEKTDIAAQTAESGEVNMNSAPPAHEDISYEEAIIKLEQIVVRLESGDTALDESMELFQEGMKLTDFCSRKLNNMEEKITKLMMQADGTVTEHELDDADNGKV